MKTGILPPYTGRKNTENENALNEVMKALDKLEYPVLFPVHPRIRIFTERLMDRNRYENICFVEPLGYLEMLFFSPITQ